MLLENYYKHIIVSNLNEKLIQYNFSFPSLILSGTISNFKNKNSILQYLYSLELVSGIRPQLRKSKQSVAAFQLKKNTLLGFKLILRNLYFFSFIERLTFAVLPREREYQGIAIPKTNIYEQTTTMIGFSNFNIFLEMDTQYHLFKNPLGLNLQFKHATYNNREISLLLSHLQFPIKNEKA
jgi:large subunit ribosomal protein L5